jgi:hypothetical protein
MKNHIGYLESTALNPSRCGWAEQKKKLPTKKPPIHTVYVVFSSYVTPTRIRPKGAVAVNLPEMFGLEARL